MFNVIALIVCLPLFGMLIAYALLEERDAKTPLNLGCIERDYIKRNYDICTIYWLSEGKIK